MEKYERAYDNWLEKPYLYDDENIDEYDDSDELYEYERDKEAWL